MEKIITHGKTELQQVCMDYGSRLRRIRGFIANVKGTVAEEGLFTPDEQETITLICMDAEDRAERKYREERTEAETRSGTATEPRQYTGK